MSDNISRRDFVADLSKMAVAAGVLPSVAPMIVLLLAGAPAQAAACEVRRSSLWRPCSFSISSMSSPKPPS